MKKPTSQEKWEAKAIKELQCFSEQVQDEIIHNLRKCLIDLRMNKVLSIAQKRKELEASIDNLKKAI